MPSPKTAPDATGGHVSRRSALGLAGASVLVAGCTDHSAGTGTPVVRRDADLPAAREATALTRAAITTITTTIAQHPGLRDQLSGALAMHQAHLRRLRSVTASGSTPAASPRAVPARPDRALAQVRAADAVHATRLDTLAQAAHSGAFARMLSSMAAAIGQRGTGNAR